MKEQYYSKVYTDRPPYADFTELMIFLLTELQIYSIMRKKMQLEKIGRMCI